MADRPSGPLTCRPDDAHHGGMNNDGVNLTYGQLESLIAGMLGVEASQRSKLVARFKLLKRLGFPPGVNVGTSRFAYDRDATMRCVLAFTLMNSMLMPPQAIAFVNAQWTMLAPEIDRIVRRIDFDSGPFDARRRPPDATLLAITTGTLERWTEPEGDVAVTASGRIEQPGTAQLITKETLEEEIVGGGPAGLSRSRLVVDLWAVVAWSAVAIVGKGWATPDQLRG